MYTLLCTYGVMHLPVSDASIYTVVMLTTLLLKWTGFKDVSQFYMSVLLDKTR